MCKALCVFVTVALVSGGVLLVGVPEAEAGTCGDNAGGPFGEGGLYGAMGNAGTGCHRHHIISSKTLEDTKNEPMPPHHPTGHGVGEPQGATVRIPKRLHIKYTPNWGKLGEGDRDQEKRDIEEVGLSEANKRAIERFIERLKDAVNDGEITQEEYDVIVKGLWDAQRDLEKYLEEGGQEEPPDGQEEGQTEVRNPGEGNPPASGETVATVDDTIVAGARGLPGAWGGQEFDLVMADAAELAKPPEDRRPVIVSSDAAVVDASGDIPETSGSLHTSYGETGGELDDFAPAVGAARVWFAWSSDHRVRASAPAEVTVYPAPEGDAPEIHPGWQQVDDAEAASWVVTAPEGETETTVELCFGDGACETRVVPGGEHSTAVGFSHAFDQPGTHGQTARVVGEAESAQASADVVEVGQACPANVPSAGFVDVGAGVHAEAIDCVSWWQVAAGGAQGGYHPAARVRRDQLASMLARLLDAAGHPVEPAGDQGFQDLAGNVHADNVDALANAGIIRGVSASRFAPGQPVRRDQMASLLVRAHERSFGALPPGDEHFEDVAGNVHREAIAKLARAGVTSGTSATTYAPAGTVTRAQMASFAMRLLSLWIEEDLVDVAAEDQPGFVEGDGPSEAPSVSASGRHVAFVSEATNLVDRDTAGAAQVFVRDRATGEITLASVGGDGQVGDAEAGEPAISADGDQIAFVSAASNLVPGDTNDAADVFVHDRASGATERVSVSSEGAQADAASAAAATSADGEHVAFTSEASNLVAGDTNGATDVFVHDRASGATERVSVSSSGGQADASSGPPAISADGRLVALASQASTLVADDTNDATDVFLRDRAEAATERVSVGDDGQEADGPSRAPSLSPNGDYVAYETAAPNLLGAADRADVWHARRHDRRDGTATVVARQADGPSHAPTVADDGRVAFVSAATNLTEDWDHNGFAHVYEWPGDDEGIVALSVDDPRGAQANADARAPAISANGAVVAFASSATNLTPATASRVPNVFVHTWRPGGVCLAYAVSAAAPE